MPLATADQLRRRPILVTVRGTDGAELQIQCRQPDLMTLVTQGWITWPALQRVREVVTDRTAGVEIDNRPIASVLEQARSIGSFVDELVCAAAVSPRIVLTEAEARADPTTVWVDDLALDVKQAIFAAVMPAPTPAVTEFRGDESPGAADRPSGEAVRDAPVDAVVGAG